MAESTTTTLRRETDETTEVEQPKSRRRGIIIIVVLLVVVVGLALWWRSTFSEDTDDAQISGHLIQISPRIAGQVIKVDVEENQVLKAGDVIAELDPRDFQVAVENAEAALASAKAAAAAQQVNVPITTVNTGSNLASAASDVSGSHAQVEQAQKQFQASQARVAQADANNIKAQADLARYRPLVEKDVISKQQFDAAVAAADAAKASLADAQASQQAAEDGVRVARDRETQSRALYKYAQTGPQQVAAQNARARQADAQVKQAQAQLDQAKLNLSYTKIIAPADGIVTRKTVEINQNVSVGQNLLTLVSLDDIWVTANFKETQLRHMGNDQSVEIHVDSTGRDYKGKVTQIGGATGSVLSLFPPENATGNYVKVVQRIPVRIDFTDLKNEDPHHLLRPGYSVEPKVTVK
ncbi:MAG TPA: HlyD family secretion protein [Terracidiphilus sp.]|nr:HlyD family secretion protein [Terracidiphilus sp.]